jgi:hypothetical protein
MAITSWPFAAQSTTETQFGQLFSAQNEFGVSGQPSSTDLKVTGDSTGMNVKVAAGFAIVRGFAFYSTAQETVTIAAANTNPRIDLVVLRLAPASDSITLAVVAGTPAASPVAPTLTQNTAANGGVYEMEIGRVTVGANVVTITAGSVSDTRPFLGTPVGRWATVSRPASPKVGHLGYNTTTSLWEFWNGSAWAELKPTSLDASVINSGTLNVAQIPDLSAAKLTSGTLPNARIANASITNAQLVNDGITIGTTDVSLGGTITTLPGVTTVNGTSIPASASLVTTTSGTATKATALAGTTAWTVPYQSASGVTSYTAVGTAGNLLTSNGSAAPTWVSPVSGVVVGAHYVNSSARSLTTTAAESTFGVNYSIGVNTTYEFEAVMYLSASNPAGDASLQIGMGGTATVTGLAYECTFSDAAASSSAIAPAKMFSSTTLGGLTTVIETTSPNVALYTRVHIKGIVRITSAGSFRPVSTLSGVSATGSLLANSHIKFTALGSNSVTSVGTWS